MEFLPIYYLIIVNIVTFITFGVDKKKAIKGSRRISEKALLILSFLGGALGGILGMHLFRHKTRKKRFSVTLPLMLIIHIALIIYIIYHFNL